jgi:hypothetical protein
MQWVITGLPLRPHPTGDELPEALGAVTGTKIGVTHVAVRDTGKKTSTFAFAHTEGVTKGLHQAVREGVPWQWQGKEILLRMAVYEVRDSDFMRAPLKLHGMADVEVTMLENWVGLVTDWEKHHFKVVKLGYDSEVEGFKGAVYGIFLRSLDWARRLFFLTQIGVKHHAMDINGNEVKTWRAVMPFVDEKMREDDTHRKLFLRGTGKVSSGELAKCLAEQVELVRSSTVDVFCLKEKNTGGYTGSAFIVMQTSAECAKLMEDYVMLNKDGWAIEASWAVPRRGEKRTFGTVQGERRHAAAAGRAWAETGQRGWVETPPPVGGANSRTVADLVVKGVDELLRDKYPHLADAQEMQKVVMAGVEAKRQMFETISHEANKMLFTRMVDYFKAVQIAVEKVGKAVAELEGLRFESEEQRQQVMTPRVYRHVEQVVGQKRQASPSAGGGSALPAPITEHATLGQANGFLGEMCDSEIGQQIMGKAAATVLDGRYTPPQERRA